MEIKVGQVWASKGLSGEKIIHSLDGDTVWVVDEHMNLTERDKVYFKLTHEFVRNKSDVSRKFEVNESKENVLKKHHHYFKDVSDYKEIDVYALCKIFEIDDPSGCTQHAIKKLLVTGKRGHKDRLRDLQDVVDTVKRLIELEAGNE